MISANVDVLEIESNFGGSNSKWLQARSKTWKYLCHDFTYFNAQLDTLCAVLNEKRGKFAVLLVVKCKNVFQGRT